MKVKLRTTQDEWHGLHLVVHNARKGTESVKVSKAALVNLLMDHSKLLDIHAGRTIDTEE